MKAELTIQLDNAAFEGEDLCPELARCLRDLARRIEEQPRSYILGMDECSRGFAVMDSNGNYVGQLNLAEIEESEA